MESSLGHPLSRYGLPSWRFDPGQDRCCPHIGRKHVDHFHSLRIHKPERREALPVEPGVIFQVDEDLRRARIRHARFCIRQVSALVRLRNRLILDIGLLPSC